MKKLNLIIIALVASLLLIGGQTYGQARKTTAQVASNKGYVKGEIMKPVEAKDAAKIADGLTQKGWKTDKYTIKEQLISTWTLMSELNEETNTAKYVFVRKVNTQENLKDTKEKNYMDAMDNLGIELMAPLMIQCKAIMEQKKINQDQMKNMMMVMKSVPHATIQRMSRKSMEIYQENDNKFTVETYFFVDKEATLKAVKADCLNYCKEKSMNKECVEIIETLFRDGSKRKF